MKTYQPSLVLIPQFQQVANTLTWVCAQTYQKLCRFTKGGIYHTSKTVRSSSPTQECFNICRLRSNIKYKTFLQKLLQKMLHFVLSSQCQIHLKYVKILNGKQWEDS